MYQEIHHTIHLDDGQKKQQCSAEVCARSRCRNHTADICFYLPFSLMFGFLGIVQIASGVFYFITIPVIKLILNIAIGCWATLCGISGGVVAIACPSTPRKHEFLLYCSLSILVLNLINLILLECGQIRELLIQNSDDVLHKEFDLLESENGRFITTYSAILSILVALIETQINFCFLNRSQSRHKKEKLAKKAQKSVEKYVDNDQTADLEYVIPRKVESNGHRRQSEDATVQGFAKSWVFEGTMDDGFHPPGQSPTASESSVPSPVYGGAGGGGVGIVGGGGVGDRGTVNHSANHLQLNPERASKLSDSNSERHNAQMSSFSRCATPSPVANSGQVTPVNPIHPEYVSAGFMLSHHTNKPSHDASHLTIEYVPSTVIIKTKQNAGSSGGGGGGGVGGHPSTATSTFGAPKTNIPPKVIVIQNGNGPPSVTSQQDDSQYASMLAELEQSLIDKKTQGTTNLSPDNTSTASTGKFGSSKSSSKDLEFSKELEAALQLIQDLETPSEGPVDEAQASANLKLARSDSEKTLSAAVSLPSPEQLPYAMATSTATAAVSAAPKPASDSTTEKGKHHIPIASSATMRKQFDVSSQSTSGYSSPNSFSSNIQLSSHTVSMGNSTSTLHDSSGSVTHDASPLSNVVRIYIEQNDVDKSALGGSAPTVCQSSANLLTKGHILNASHLIETIARDREMNRSFLLFKKRAKPIVPCTEFKNRILQSESLAYLTDEELVARHRSNRDVIRTIEKKVAQKIRGSPRYSDFIH